MYSSLQKGIATGFFVDGELEKEEALAYHMFSPRHQSLIDNLGGIIAPGIDVDAFLDDRV